MLIKEELILFSKNFFKESKKYTNNAFYMHYFIDDNI